MKTIIALLALVLLTGRTGLAQLKVGTPSGAPNSTLQVAGSVALNYTEVSTSTVLNATHHFVNVNAATATTITLPAITGIMGREYIVRNTGTGTVSIIVAGGGTINVGSSNLGTLSATTGQTFNLYAGSTQWQGISNVTSITNNGTTSALQSMIIQPIVQNLTPAGAGGNVVVTMDGTTNFSNSIVGGSYNSGTNQFTMPAGIYTVTWNYTGSVSGSGAFANFFWDVPGLGNRIHYGGYNPVSGGPFGVTVTFTMTLTAATTNFTWNIGTGSNSLATSYNISSAARLTIIKIQ
jgi:hypothetical protein